MHGNTLGDNITPLEKVPYALIPAHFVRSWNQWLNRPADVPRPEMIDNTPFICEHNLLVLDPNSPSDFNSYLAIVKRSDWDVLETLYVQVIIGFVNNDDLLP